LGLLVAIFIAVLGIKTAVISLFLVVGFLAQQIKRRRKNFTRHLPDALEAMSQALRAGLSLPQAIALVEREMSGAVKDVFGALRRAHDYQITLKDALSFLEPQIKTTEWSMVSQALLMQERAGGNIVPILAQLAATIRQRLSIEKEVQTATASGRLSGLIISALVPVSFLMFASFNPQYLQILTDTTIGKLMLAIAALLEIIGFAIIWRLVRINI
jgi:tight adherence protein B